VNGFNDKDTEIWRSRFDSAVRKAYPRKVQPSGHGLICFGTLRRVGSENPTQLMKPSLLLASLIAILGCTMTSCVSPEASKMPATCGFSDPETCASLGICYLTAEYYVAHGEWPASREQLAAQSRSLLESGQGDISDDEAVEISSFMNRFDLVELHKKDKNLVIRYRFNLDGKTVGQSIMLQPRPTVDEIIQSATEAE
jgi:hypothetical protein